MIITIYVCQVDHKKYESTDLGYLTLPSTRAELVEGVKPSVAGLVLTNKDTFNIQTNVCSTKLTQNGLCFFIIIQYQIYFYFD